jgi:hypothetical protein
MNYNKIIMFTKKINNQIIVIIGSAKQHGAQIKNIYKHMTQKITLQNHVILMVNHKP